MFVTASTVCHVSYKKFFYDIDLCAVPDFCHRNQTNSSLSLLLKTQFQLSAIQGN